MKLTTKSEYSILALVYIARNQGGNFVKAEDISEKYSIPKKYLEFLLSVLKQNSLVKSKRGAFGGHRLAKPANIISFAQIIRIMDGPLAPTESVSKYFYAPTPLSQEGKILEKFREIRDYISDELEALKISDLI